MNYRNFDAANMEVSLLGFGAMRLPDMGDGSGRIDEAETIRMIRYAIDHGVNYVDTAYVYHGKQSEAVVGKALADGYREKVLLATKMPFWILKDPDEMAPVFDEQLEKLGTDCIDMYLVHGIDTARWGTVKDWKIWEFLKERRDAGKIRFIGFSSHCDTPADFKEILDAYPWDFCQLQINFMDKKVQAGIEGYEYAASKGVPVVVMEPLKGGKLTDIMPPSVERYWDRLAAGRSPAEWALRWVANLPGVLTILSGMSDMAQVEENVRVLSDADAGKLSEEELAVFDGVAEEYNKLIVYPCTACRYCMPCTEGICIPEILDFRNSCDLYGITKKLQYSYRMFVEPKASACAECGKCEGECPQHLDIMRAMKETTEKLE
ncbi:MAG: aldo/keto reductase [Clostridiales bacterium]|nr:aldo/keto reductase [Clostridiales bacterium]